MCKDSDYHYEVNCLEYRPGTGVPVTGGMYVPQYTQLDLGADTAKAMLQAADLGTNIQRLYQHELYFRTNGLQGERLNSVDLERLYQNMSVWLWNETKYRYEEGKEDELGFKTFTEFLNCYTNNAYVGTQCSAELKKSLIDNKMIYGEESSKAGMMNPSYPLNYMEKPLTRLMLGRSWWDLNIKVDVEKYPGAVSEEGQNVTETISLYSNPTKWFAGNMQSTGLWAPAQKEVTIKSNANVPVTVTVALADDLTGREKHEVALNRPPRVTKTYSLDASGTVKFKVPYGGLIYIKGDSKDNESASFTFTGVVKAPFYKDGAWKNDLNSPAPLGELESDAFVYTAPKKNLNASNYTGGLKQFANDLDTFASSMNDFYGRNEEDGKHRMFTYKNLTGHKHRFANDVQISIGDAHSGYQFMQRRQGQWLPVSATRLSAQVTVPKLVQMLLQPGSDIWQKEYALELQRRRLTLHDIELELQKEAKKKTPQIRFSPFEPATPFTLRFYSAAQNACWAVKLAHDGALSLNQCDERMP